VTAGLDFAMRFWSQDGELLGVMSTAVSPYKGPRRRKPPRPQLKYREDSPLAEFAHAASSSAFDQRLDLDEVNRRKDCDGTGTERANPPPCPSPQVTPLHYDGIDVDAQLQHSEWNVLAAHDVDVALQTPSAALLAAAERMRGKVRDTPSTHYNAWQGQDESLTPATHALTVFG
jgi:hypothetical protein